MIRFRLSIFFISIFLPLPTLAAITINEVAWMGSSVSANHEWIELYNDGSAQNVDGWILTDGQNLSITLQGTIPAGGFAVLERSSDESAPGSAFFIYTGALVNTGATLSLRRVDGGLEDQVAGGEDWQNIGGDNTTKETAQYTPGGWITANATPGETNVTERSTTPVESKETTSSGSARLAKPVPRETVVLVHGANELSLSIDAPKRVFVNQPVSFRADVIGVGKTIENSLKYHWNFGDANASEYKEPTHVFFYPGTYVVHVSAEFGLQEAQSSMEVTVLPVAISLTTNSDNDVQINNDSPYLIDLSGYRLRAQEVIELPPFTQLLPNQTITIPSARIGNYFNTLVALYDTQKTIVASIMPNHFNRKLVTTAVSADVVRSVQASTDTHNPTFGFADIVETDVVIPTVEQSEEVSDINAEPTLELIPTSVIDASREEKSSANWSIIALIVLLLGSTVVVLMQPKKTNNSF